MTSKSKVATIFPIFKSLVETQFTHKVKFLRIDGGGKYCNQTMANYLAKADIIHQTTCPYIKQQNGVA